MKTRRQFLTRSLQGLASLSAIAFLGMKVPKLVWEAAPQRELTVEMLLKARDAMLMAERGVNPPVYVDDNVMRKLRQAGYSDPPFINDQEIIEMPTAEQIILGEDCNRAILEAFYNPPTRGQG